MDYDHRYDVERNGTQKTSVDDLEKRNGLFVYDNAAVPGESFEVGGTFYARMQRLAGKLKIEQRGIERVPENERTDTGLKALLNTSTMVRTAFDQQYLRVERLRLTSHTAVAVRQHGCLLLCHWDASKAGLL